MRGFAARLTPVVESQRPWGTRSVSPPLGAGFVEADLVRYRSWGWDVGRRTSLIVARGVTPLGRLYQVYPTRVHLLGVVDPAVLLRG
ncbi:hypothetical protein GCM10029964_014440 [Kibdelosporangium lantanae]